MDAAVRPRPSLLFSGRSFAEMIRGPLQLLCSAFKKKFSEHSFRSQDPNISLDLPGNRPGILALGRCVLHTKSGETLVSTQENSMTFKQLRISALTATFLVGGAALAMAQSSSTVGTGGSSAGGGTSNSTVGTGGSSAGGSGSGSASTLGTGGSSAGGGAPRSSPGPGGVAARPPVW